MLRIIVDDLDKGFTVDFKAEGSLDDIAQQLNAIYRKVAEVNPKIVELMEYYNKLDLHPEEN